MPVFDFSKAPADEKEQNVCTYTIIRSDAPAASPEAPIMVLDNRPQKWAHHSDGRFTNPDFRTSFEFDEEGGIVSADILQIDSRFTARHVHLRWPR